MERKSRGFGGQSITYAGASFLWGSCADVGKGKASFF